jgi:hypothetical protein
MDNKPDWTGLGGYIEGTTLKSIGGLRKHSSMPGCWVGTMRYGGEKIAIVIHEGQQRPPDWEPGMEDEPALILFENPGATLMMRDAEGEHD